MLIQMIVLATVLGAEPERPLVLDMILDWDGRSLPLAPCPEIDDVSRMLMATYALADEDRAELHMRQSDARYWMADRTGSAGAAQEALQIQPDSVRARWLLARAWLGSPENREEALKLGKQLVSEHPQSAEGYLVIGRYDVETNRLPEAVAALQKAIERDPGNPRAYLVKALAHFRMEQYIPCLEGLEVGLRQAPFDGESCGKLHQLFGRATFRIGEVNEATAQLLVAHQMNPKSREIMETLWACLGQQRKFASGWALTKKMTRMSPPNSTAYWMHARSLAQVGDLNAAGEAADRAVKLSPEDPAAWTGLGVVHMARGDFPEAVEAWQKSLQIRGAPDTDTALRLALLRSTCPDKTLRHGEHGRQLAMSALRTLRLAEHRRVATIVLAITHAECGDTKTAAQMVTSVLEIGHPDTATIDACNSLAALFRDGKPYRYDPQANAAPIFDLPPARLLSSY